MQDTRVKTPSVVETDVTVPIVQESHGILEDQDIFEAFIDNCDPKSFGPSLAKGNDFSTFWDNAGWGNG